MHGPAGPGDRRIVIAPNCLRGYASAAEVARALAEGVAEAFPQAETVCLPLADGGDGTLDVLAAAVGGRAHHVDAYDALGQVRSVRWLELPDGAAAIESAGICGLGALTPGRLDPLGASSRGVGQVIVAALEAGMANLVLGLGGTAVVDGGAGALAALGARFTDAAGRDVDPVPRHLDQAASVDLEPARARLAGTSIALWSDVRTPLSGNLDSFGAQKGLHDGNRPQAARALRHLVNLLAATDPGAPDRFAAPWFGAGGGTGFGLSGVARTEAAHGAEALAARVDPEDLIGRAALVLTAEGAVDASSWHGKLTGAIARRRSRAGRPTALLAVHATGGEPPALTSIHTLSEPGAGLTPITGAALHRGLAEAARQACVRWKSHLDWEQP
ncbi:MAG TPA: glycerate kinase [Actinocrinis sp.]|nr:glycerate kinase [Actinocrinis sp.]